MGGRNRGRRAAIVSVALVAALLAPVVARAGANARDASTHPRVAAMRTDPVPAAHIDTMAQRGGEHGILKVNDNKEFNGQTAFARWYPFDKLPDSAQMAVPILRNLPHYAHRTERTNDGHFKSTGDTWQIWALGFLTGDGTIDKPWVMNSPPASLMKHLFEAPPTGLGADPESFFVRNFRPSSLDHYPERDTPTGWCYSMSQADCRGAAVAGDSPRPAPPEW